jgi:hypothetical protein
MHSKNRTVAKGLTRTTSYTGQTDGSYSH